MTALREAAQQFVADYENGDLGDMKHYARALRAALAQEEQEPVAGAWRDPATDDIVSVARRAAWETDYGLGGKGRAATYTEPLYAHPPRREWRGLTMQEINALPEVGGRMWNMGSAVSVLRAIRAVEAALKEKNHG
jgi:hypothetical protein